MKNLMKENLINNTIYTYNNNIVSFVKMPINNKNLD